MTFDWHAADVEPVGTLASESHLGVAVGELLAFCFSGEKDSYGHAVGTFAGLGRGCVEVVTARDYTLPPAVGLAVRTPPVPSESPLAGSSVLALTPDAALALAGLLVMAAKQAARP